MKRRILFSYFYFIPAIYISQAGGRQVIPINDNWRFSFINNVTRQWTDVPVTLPHTWNTNEISNPKVNYQRTNAVYRKKLFIPAEENVPLQKGKNRVEAKTAGGKTELHDTCGWELTTD